jgi:hypothetical protein
MYQLAYVSKAVVPFSEKELDDVLRKSRRNNMEKDITGLLLYCDSNFIQFLEGPMQAVLSLLAKIKSDCRHRDLVVVQQQERDAREFSDWSMGFRKIEAGIFEVHGHADLVGAPLDERAILAQARKVFGDSSLP